MRVLVADDDPVIRTVVGVLLRRQGHVVLESPDGDAAWQLVQEQHPDLVIADWEMPGHQGLDLLRLVRERDGGHAYTYFILLTSRGDAAAIAASSAAGVDDHLPKPLDPHELERRMAVAERLTNLQHRLEAANRRMRDDLLAAQKTQMALIPPRPPTVPGLVIDWRLRPCDELAGDLLGAFRLDEHHLAFHVIDISGHGVAAALLAVQVARYLTPLASAGSLLKSVGPTGHRLTPPVEVARALNDIFQRDNSLQFLTMAYGILDLRTWRLSMALSGHPGPLLLRHADGTVERPEVASHPLGMFPTDRLSVSTWETDLRPRDRLLIFSDGASEANGPDGEFGTDRMAQALGGGLDAILQRLAEWTNGPFQDDVSLLLIERAG